MSKPVFVISRFANGKNVFHSHHGWVDTTKEADHFPSKFNAKDIGKRRGLETFKVIPLDSANSLNVT